MAMTAALLELKLTLVDIKPPIWRRLLVPNDISLKRLHQIIQAIAYWRDYHLHEFVIAEKRYGRPAPREVVPVHNETLVRLNTLPLAEGTSFTYVYDFGDHWEIEVKVERILPRDPEAPYRLVLAGGRAFPPDDSGGASGYETFLDALSDPANPEHEGYRRWIGEGFDPERFDPEATNERLRLLISKLA
jgi:Plasmid pRiA4b ORF-3-like protein